MAGSALDTVSADEARVRLVDQLVADGSLTSPAVERAFRRVPRHLFAPDDISVDAAYADDVVIPKRGPERARDEFGSPFTASQSCRPCPSRLWRLRQCGRVHLAA
ncbi:hypothetical protein [Micromonospora sp. 15K316]|uniref:hypothetical protein n=1 Tax=Micromonospora sp. 15K316 TaxID=2530376 RepID=UPI001FB7F8CD|nr:hypothetical protein [Micromonospora sp. 15K316]